MSKLNMEHIILATLKELIEDYVGIKAMIDSIEIEDAASYLLSINITEASPQQREIRERIVVLAKEELDQLIKEENK